MTFLARLAVALAVPLCLLTAGPAAAQGVSILNPIARSYSALGFVFPAPQGDGWREIGSAPDAFRIVYAEQMGEQINTRADFAAQAFVVPEPEKVPDAFTLTRMSMAQRVEEKGDTLVAMAQVQPVAAGLPVHEYTIVFKMDEKDFFEHHFVAIAPDKSQYLAAKLVTEDQEFRSAPYFAPLTQAVAALEFPAANTAPSADSAAQAPTGSSADAPADSATTAPPGAASSDSADAPGADARGSSESGDSTPPSAPDSGPPVD